MLPMRPTEILVEWFDDPGRIDITRLGKISAEQLRDLTHVQVVVNHHQPIAALISYDTYLIVQDLVKRAALSDHRP